MSYCKKITISGRYILSAVLISITNLHLHGQCLQLSDSLYRAAEALYTEGQMPRAGNIFMQSAEIESSCPGGTYENISGALSNAAVCFEADNDFKNADAANRKLSDLARKSGDTATMASAYLSLSRYAMSEARFLQASAYADTSLNLYGQYGDRKGQVEAVELIADQLIFHGMYDNVISLIVPFIDKKNTFSPSEINLFQLKTATVYRKANIPDSALKYYILVLNYEQSVNGEAAGEYAFALGECYAQLGKKIEALQYYQLSNEIYTRKNNIYGMAVSLSLCGRTLSELGRPTDGLQKLKHAQKLFAHEDYQAGEASALMSMGSIFANEQNLDSAYSYFSDARNIAISSGDSFLANKILGLISDMYYQEGNYENAERIYQMAINELPEQKSADRSAAYNSLGLLYQRLGRDEDALTCLTEAHRLAIKSGDYNMMGQTYFCKGKYNYESGNYGDALLSYRNALDAFSRIRSLSDVIMSHEKIGQVLSSIGQYRDALVSLNTAHTMAMHIYDKLSAASSNIAIASVYDKTGMPDSSTAYLSKAIMLYKQIGRRDLLASTLNKMARHTISLHKYAESLVYLEESLAILLSLSKETNIGSRTVTIADLEETYRLMGCANLGMAKCQQAFNFREAASVIGHENILGKQMDITSTTIGNVQAKLNKNKACIVYSISSNADAYVTYIGATESVCVKLATERFAQQILADTSAKKIALEGTLRLDKPLVQDPQTKKITLDAQNALALAGGFIAGYYSLVGQQEDAQNQEQHFARMIYDYMLKPIELLYSSKTQLVFSCDSVFHYSTFETLLTGDSVTLAKKHSIRYVQSFSLAEHLSARTYGERTTSIADFSVIAPHSIACIHVDKPIGTPLQRQARRIYQHTNDKAQMSKLYSRMGYTNTLGNNRTNASAAQSVGTTHYTDIAEGSLKSLSESNLLTKFRYLHFSLPGITVAGVPEMAAIMLLPGGGDDGFLTSAEIAGLKLRADLVSLSGFCSPPRSHSGGTYEIAVPMYAAGANAILVSQWPTDLEFVSAFMQTFYRHTETCNNDFADALFKTRNEFISGTHGFAWSLPYFWGSFMLQGTL